jgi:hypothetical protein
MRNGTAETPVTNLTPVTDATNAAEATEPADAAAIHFCLPQGHRDPAGVWHRAGIMRPALAREEIRAQSDFRVYVRPESFLHILLARVVLKLGTLEKLDVGIVERLPAEDRAFLERLYLDVNGYLPSEVQ